MKTDLNQFVEWLKNKNLKDRTIENYVYYFNKFTYDSLNQESISKFLSLKQHRNSIARGFLVNYQKFLMVNYKELGLDQDTRIEISEIELPKITGRTKERLIKPLSKDEILLIERQFTDEKEKLQLLISYFCGLRLGEMIKIRIIDFNWNEWKKDIKKIGECRVYGKGDKEGLALVPSNIMVRISKYIRSKDFPSADSYIFLNKGVTLNNLNIKNRTSSWTKKLKKAGIDAKITQLDRDGKIIKETSVHPHKLRHSWGYHLRSEKGMDIRDIKEILRHSSIQNTQIYTYTDKEHLKKQLEE